MNTNLLNRRHLLRAAGTIITLPALPQRRQRDPGEPPFSALAGV